jgi:hypothetical protein
MDEQQVRKLSDVWWQCLHAVHTNPWFEGKSTEEVAEWVSKKLADAGFPNGPLGSNHIYLHLGERISLARGK